MRSPVDPHITALLLDLYRLALLDPEGAIELFARLCRDGYHPEIHRRTLAAIEGRRKGQG
jgi:hypothetical protein